MVEVFINGRSTTKVDAHQRNELRDYMTSVGLTPEEINHNVHELYLTNAIEFVVKD